MARAPSRLCRTVGACARAAARTRARARACTVAATLAGVAADAGAQRSAPDAGPWRPTLPDGRYRNPIVWADYSDPDVIRVGDDYWMTASSFGHLPGLPILHSRDLVHWRIVNHAVPRLGPDFDVPQHGNGIWAPSLRHHAGWYWIFWGDPDRGIYMTRARDPRGAWSPPHLVHAAKGWIDPTPLWDADGRAWLAHAWARSRSGIKHRLDVAEMAPDGTRLLDAGRTVFVDSVRHPTLEGPKFYRRDGWYWLLAPAGGVATGWQVALRARDPLGPYEVRTVLAQGATAVNGPHQGGWVDTPAGEHWFLHFQDVGAGGRIVHLQPMRWRADGWPVIGAARDGDTTGAPVAAHAVPRVRGPVARHVPQTSDEFDGRALGLQWQWQANPRRRWWSLAARPGALRLHAEPLVADARNLWGAPHLLLQKLPAPTFTADARLEAASTTPGETFGLVVFGLDYAWLGVRRTADGWALVQARVARADTNGVEPVEVVRPLAVPTVTLRATVRDGARVQLAWSADGRTFADVGAPFTAREGKWVGAKVGLFALAASSTRSDSGARVAPPRGHVDVHWFRVR